MPLVTFTFCDSLSMDFVIFNNQQNPGFDFSGAEISGNFHGGGPDFSSLQK